MKTQEFSIEAVSGEYENLGGRGLTSELLRAEVNPRAYALGRENKLIIAPGLLTGTIAPSSGRCSMGAKSPLTGTVKESNVGGTAGQYLAAHGIKALILEDQCLIKRTWILIVDGKNLKFTVRDDLKGMGNYQTVAALRQEFGMTSAIISIGPAGEAGAALATVAVSDLEGRPARHAGRGGMGAVMGSKGVKAIVIIRPEKPVVAVADPEQFAETAKEFAKMLSQTKKGLQTYGTALLVNPINAVGGLPTRNFSTGYNSDAEKISGEELHQICNERGGKTGHSCSRGCAIRCSNVFNDQSGNYVTAGLEYETIALLGSNCGINDLDSIAELDRLCDDLGMDTMETGSAMGVAMEAGEMPFGDLARMKEVISNIVTGDVLGRVIGQGAVVTGRVLGVERVPAVKGQSMSAYEPRALKGTGVTYATSTMGADHTTGNCLPGRGGLKGDKQEGQVALSRELQIITMVCDFLGLCIFIGPLMENMPFMASLTSAFTGSKVSVEMLLDQARQILRTEMAFNESAGIGVGQNDLPAFFRTEPLPNNGLVFDVPYNDLKEFSFD